MKQFLLCLLLGLGLINGCGKEKKETPAERIEGSLPSGVWSGKNKKLLLSVSPNGLSIRDDNRIAFRIVDSSLNPVSLEGIEIYLKYEMPSMQGMGYREAKAAVKGPGVFEATIDIPHGPDWRITLSLKREGGVWDEFILDFDVKS